MRRIFFWLIIVIGLHSLAAKTPVPPLAPMDGKSTSIHDQVIHDPWHWTRDRKDPRLPAVLKAEEQYAQACLKDSKKLADKLFKEYKNRIPKDDVSARALVNGYYYFSRQTSKQDYPVYLRQQDAPGAKVETLLDLNKMAKGKQFFDVGLSAVSPDNRVLAYTADLSGAEVYRLYLKDLGTGKITDTKLDRIADFVWQLDSRHAIIVTENDIMRSDKCLRLDLDTREQTLLYEEKDPAFNLGLYRWGDRSWVFLSAGSKNSSEAWIMPLDDLTGSFQAIAGRRPELEYSASILDKELYIHTNLWNPDYSIAHCSLNASAIEDWQQYISAPQGASIWDFSLFDDKVVVETMRGGHDQLAVYERSTGKLLDEIIPEQPSDLGLWNNLEPGASGFNYYSESWLRPYQIYQHGFDTKADSLIYTKALPKGYDPDKYTSSASYYVAEDGTRIPLTLIHKKELPEGPKPVWLNGYGAYGDVESPWFSSSRQSMLDRGVIFALAHIRGGGEMGKAWHDAGRLLHKKNSFTDFRDAVEYLISSGLTTPGQLLIEGGSAGGLLMGAVTNMIPTRVKAVIADVPFVDVINTMLDPDLPLTVGEYAEWGDPNDPKYFSYMLSYSPYDNVGPEVYPQMLISSGWMDYRVGYWEGLKWAQKLRLNNMGDSRIIYLLQKDEGHSGSSKRYASLKSYARSVAWGISQITGLK